MTDCLADTGAAGSLPLLLVGVLVLTAGAVVLVLLRRRRGSGGGRGAATTTLAIVLAVLAASGALQLGGAAAPATASVSSAEASACPSAGPTSEPTPAPTPTPTTTPVQPVIGADQEVAFDSGGVTFHGSFRGPTDTSQPVPAVVIVVGTGGVDRNGNAPTLDTEAYEWLADVMSANGVASLRYDKLGTGATGLGPYAADPDEMLALGYDQLRVQPIRDALSFVAEQPGVDSDRILLLGHSEGGADSLIVATELGDAPALAGLLLIEPAYTHILDVVSSQFSVQMEAAVAAGAMTADDEQTLADWMAAGVAEIRTGTPPYPAPGPVPLPDAVDMTAVFQSTIESNIYGSDPAQMVVTHAYRTLYGKQYDAVDPYELPPLVSVPTLVTCGTKDFNTPCGDGTPDSGVVAVAGQFAPGVAEFTEIPDMVHILRDVGSADVPQPADQIAYPFSSVLETTLGDWLARFADPR
ncbi:LPXTG cell wall anchor domain-containing protein [Herbiconiux moechotypicola]|uniref:Alpha/beta fold hydrolase n=1 Tax=Herbiconiux moechotypicola TaxID=637393 RepID=A0ABN3DFU9_9MICO|nr:LPXTG cell wall anchor domain-containing protein [Herbiconiux moechotypicola]MCS5729381.1 LPXTG cell wall anchor domain-containing protein [Herbiconiux moechotypicola]